MTTTQVRPSLWAEDTQRDRWRLFRSPPVWAASFLIVAASVLLLHHTVPVAVAYPRAAATAAGLFALFAIPFIALYRRMAWLQSMPAGLHVVAFLWGGTVAVMTSIFAVGAVRGLLATAVSPLWAETWSPVLGAPIVEELIKAVGVVMVALLAPWRLRSVLDGIFCGVFVGVGFQVIEGYAFALSATMMQRTGDVTEPAMSTFIVRGILAGLWSHAVLTAIVGAGIAYVIVRRTKPLSHRLGLAFLAFAAAVGFHALWNSPLLRDGFGLGTPGIFIGVLVKGLPAVVLAAWLLRRFFLQEVQRRRELLRDFGVEGVAPQEAETLLSWKAREAAVVAERKRSGRKAAARLRRRHRRQLRDLEALHEQHG
ncbi:PrsW family intramembrane metalloprotease [Natronoglycomyces albus]|uniref:PrsW family intramembrane metalloprotease n=1 Tax=Natronoglycomyces albus TaxID=2811108 RepID=A0A895XIU6_9ACTN|nr:PrsW family intramembrane metalloprotease [Natronoglycomyces albus]QSB05264.1 PrsW family intramembrane metalloprotease [Natronoglycomyces albus]